MLRPFLITSLVVLAKLNFGDGVGYGRYGAPPFRQSSSSLSAAPPPPARSLTPIQSSRFNEKSSALPQSSSSLRGGPYNTKNAPVSPQSRRFAGTAAKPLPPAPAYSSDRIQEQNFGDDDFGGIGGLLAGGGDIQQGGYDDFSPSGNGSDRRRSQNGGGYGYSEAKMVVTFPNSGKKIEIPADLFQPGESVTEGEINRRLKKREEERDPLTKQINTNGEVIEQQLPSGGRIVVKISGSNINQRRMNKLREMMTNSISLVFEHTEFRSGLISRFI